MRVFGLRSLRHVTALAACVALAVGAPSAQARVDTVPPLARITFDGAPIGQRWLDATAFGAWYSLHDGFGRTQVESTKRGPVLTMTTRAPESLAVTFSSLVHTRRAFRDVDFTLTLRTVAQLRRPAPNPWEVAWVLWRYTDNRHFYAFIAKPNGFELAKQDVAYKGSQRFLAVSYASSFPTGTTYRIRVRHIGNTMCVWVNGIRLVRYTDRERPLRSGSIALYAEDSSVRYGPLELRPIN